MGFRRFQIFGKPPQIEQGAMWVIRKEEMQRMAETITKTRSSYFLDFMNLDVPLNVLSDLKSDNEKTVERIGRKNWPSTHQQRGPAFLAAHAATSRLSLGRACQD